MPARLTDHPAQEVRPVRRRAGFTLFEVILVLILMAVLATVLAPKGIMVDQDRTNTIEALKTRIRYAQMRAMSGESVYGVNSNGNSYWLFSGGDVNSRERFPGASADAIQLPDGLVMDLFTLSFSDRGIPYTDAAATPGSELTGASAAASITVGGQAAAIRITPQTGYIPD